jgi:hypothetical protein
MVGEKLSAPQDLMKCLERRTEREAASYASNPFTPSFKLRAMLVEDLKRFHVELELHLVSGPRGRVRLEAAVIHLHVVDVRVAELLERLGNPRVFLFGGGTVLKGSRWSGLRDKKKDSESSDNYLHNFSTVARRRRSSSRKRFLSGGCQDHKGNEEFSQSKELFIHLLSWRPSVQNCFLS